MDSSATVPPALATSRIAQAHAFFVREITDWAEPTGDPDKCQVRLKALAQAVHGHHKLVVIDLETGDNAQVIFETLNHRGAPLLGADLVNNLVFQRAQALQLDVQKLYHDFWAPLDSDYWRELTAQGRPLLAEDRRLSKLLADHEAPVGSARGPRLCGLP